MSEERRENPLCSGILYCAANMYKTFGIPQLLFPIRPQISNVPVYVQYVSLSLILFRLCHFGRCHVCDILYYTYVIYLFLLCFDVAIIINRLLDQIDIEYTFFQ